MAKVGDVTIEIKADTDEFDKQIASIEKQVDKTEKKKIIIEARLDKNQADFEKATEKTNELGDAYQRLKKLQETLDSGKGTPAQFAEFQDLQATYGSLEQLDASFMKALDKQDALEMKVMQTKFRYDEVNQSLEEYKNKIDSVELQRQLAQAEELKKRYEEIGNSVKSGFKGVGNSIQDSINKVARLALGIFGLRSAYMAVRRASSELATYDQQYATNIEYIRYALTQMIAPVLRYIVSLVATILGYINAILNAWFGINIFGKASAKDFQKMKAGASGAVKAVKEIKKQLAGFDEINMLSDQSDSGGGGGGGAGGAMPNFDLSSLNAPIPAWLEWIINNKDLILAVMAGIASALLAWKLGLDAIKALGIGVLVAGIVYTIQALLAYLKDPSWTNFGKIIQGIGVAIAGVGLIIGSVPTIVAGAIVLIVGTIIKYWNEIKAFLQKGIDWLRDKGKVIREKFGDTVGDLYDMAVRILQSILDWLDNTFTNLKTILDGIIQFVKGVFTRNWSMAWEGIKKIAGAVWDWILNTVIKVFQSMNDFIQTKIQVITNLHNKLWDAMKMGASNALNFIKSIFSGIASWFGGVINNVINMFRNFGTRAGEVIGGAFKGAVNGVLRAIESILNTPIRAINNLISTINAVPRNKSWLLKNI